MTGHDDAGPTGPQRFVLGSWGLAGAGIRARSSYGTVDAGQSSAVLDAAWEAGLRRIDTALSYGDGDGLRRIAAWQRSTGCRWQIVAKPGRPVTDNGPVSRTAPALLLEEVERIADFVGPPDVVLVKDPPEPEYVGGQLPGVLDRLEALLPRALVGVASHRPDLACDLPGGIRTRIAQVELNGVNRFMAVPPIVKLSRSAAGGTRPPAWRVWAMQPLAYGYLADPRRIPAPEDWRSRIPDPSLRLLRATAAAFVERLRASVPIGAGKDPAALAIAYCLCVPGVDRVVVGPRTTEQLRSSLGALSLVDDVATRQGLQDVVAVEFGSGR